ncbi:MAG: mannitol dehydrogenase family protein, partial [Moorella sp. (in: firmicutes)]
MPVLSRAGIQDKRAWEEANIELPQFDYDEMAAATKENPVWIHFGAGNIFRGFIAMLQQTLLNGGRARGGIVAAEGFDLEIIDRIYLPHDNLSLLVIMNSDGTMDKKVVASIGEALKADVEQEEDWRRLQEIFARPSLQIASFTITEKGYSLKDINGEYYEIVKADMARGPEKPSHIMAKIAALSYVRYKKGALPIAFVSMDNHSRNGEKFREAVTTIAKKWAENGLVEKGFLTYLTDEARVSFPWTMIDKIVPRPSETIRDALLAAGFNGMEILCTKKNTFIAPFVNTERPQYLVIEDNFPNSRPPLELAGVMFTDRQTVERTEQMKVCTCLNPLHTALAVFGCLLGYNLIADTLKDEQLRRLVEKIGYEEGLPVVVDPGILNPRAFIKEVIEERLPNPY